MVTRWKLWLLFAHCIAVGLPGCSFRRGQVFRCVRKIEKKRVLGFVMPVLQPALNDSASTGRIFMKFDVWRFFENRENSSFSSKYDKENRYFTWSPICIYRGADKSLARPDCKNNWKVAIFRPTWRSLLPRRPGWTDKLLSCFCVACRKSLVAVACFLPGRAEDLSAPR